MRNNSTKKKGSNFFFGMLIIALCYGNTGCHRADFIGKPLPDFSLSPFQDPATGQSFLPVISRNLKGKKTLIVVWASWCGACHSLHHSLMELAKTYEWRIVGIVISSPPEKVGLFLRENGNPYSALSPGRRIKGLPLGGAIPLLYFVSADGIIRDFQRGNRIPSEWLK